MLERLYNVGVKFIKRTAFIPQKRSKKVLFKFNRAVFKLLQLRVRRKPKQIIFESRRGKKYICNPRALYEHMLNDSRYDDYNFVWVVRKSKGFTFLKKNPRTKIVIRKSFSYLRAYAQSKYWIANHMAINYMTPARDQVYLQTWHGKPIKRLGGDARDYTYATGKTGKMRRKRYLGEDRKISQLLSPAPVFSAVMASAFGLRGGAKDARLLQAGYPRNAALFTYTNEDIARLKKEFFLPEDKKVILYAPTWRSVKHEKGIGYIYHNPLDFSLLKQELGDEYILLFRGHNLEASSINLEKYQNFVRDVTNIDDVNDLYLVSDLLISDYSGTIFDFANLKRPMVYYLFDWEDYSQKQNGVYFDPHDFPGIVAKTQDELPSAIRTALFESSYDEEYAAFNEKFNPWEGAQAPSQVAEQFIMRSA